MAVEEDRSWRSDRGTHARASRQLLFPGISGAPRGARLDARCDRGAAPLRRARARRLDRDWRRCPTHHRGLHRQLAAEPPRCPDGPGRGRLLTGCPRCAFFSGGTAPSAVNARTIRALQAIGFEVEPTGEEAPRGEPDLANPKYRVRWGTGGSEVETVEFSKAYDNPSNPRGGFAALMVCDEANAGCPSLRGRRCGCRCRLPTPRPRTTRRKRPHATRPTRDALGRLMMAVLGEAAEAKT